MNRKSGAFLLLISLFLVGSVYFWQRSPKVTLTLGVFAGSNWDVPSGNSYKVIDEAIERFEKKHPNVEIKYDSGILKGNYSQWLSEKVVLGKVPDIFMVLSEDFNTLSSLGAMKELDSLIEKDADFNKQAYYQSAIQSGVYQKEQYALPYESNPTLMFVNKTLLEKEGIEIPKNDWTLTDFYQIAQEITKDSDGDGRIDQYGYYDYDWLDSIFAHGAQLFDEEGEQCFINQTSVKDSIHFLEKLQQLNRGYLVSADDFDQGVVAFAPMQLSQYRTYKPYPWRVKKYSNFEWDCLQMPKISDDQGHSQTSTLLMGLSAYTQQEDLSWEFLKMLCYDESIQQSLIAYSQGISPLKKVTKSEQMTSLINAEGEDSMVNLDLLNEVMADTVNHGQFKKYQSALNLIDTKLQQLMNTNEDLDITLITLQNEIDQYLKE